MERAECGHFPASRAHAVRMTFLRHRLTAAAVRSVGPALSGVALAAPMIAFGAVPAGAASLPTCAFDHLSAKLTDGEGAAGSQYLTIRFTNTGRHSCVLDGHPGVSLVTASHRQVGLTAKRANDSVRTVRLDPGEKADAVLRITNALNYPKAQCKPTAVRALRVIPPDSTRSFYLTLHTTTCAKDVRTMTINAVGHH
jgi:uncharacterized cupredoxin-like copper-binding protein